MNVIGGHKAAAPQVQQLLSMPNIDAALFFSYADNYVDGAGSVRWYRSRNESSPVVKPVVSARYALWNDSDTAVPPAGRVTVESLVEGLRGQPKNPKSIDGYEPISA